MCKIQFFHFSQGIWKKSTVKSFGDQGWLTIVENLEPIWLTIPTVSKSCSELVKRRCNTSCRGRCKCEKFGFVCTELCTCNGYTELYAIHLVGWQRNFYLFFTVFWATI